MDNNKMYFFHNLSQLKPIFLSEVRPLDKLDLLPSDCWSQRSGYSPHNRIMYKSERISGPIIYMKVMQRRPDLLEDFLFDLAAGRSSALGTLVGHHCSVMGVRTALTSSVHSARHPVSAHCTLATELEWAERELDDTMVLWCKRWTQCNTVKTVLRV